MVFYKVFCFPLSNGKYGYYNDKTNRKNLFPLRVCFLSLRVMCWKIAIMREYRPFSVRLDNAYTIRYATSLIFSLYKLKILDSKQ